MPKEAKQTLFQPFEAKNFKTGRWILFMFVKQT